MALALAHAPPQDGAHHRQVVWHLDADELTVVVRVRSLELRDEFAASFSKPPRAEAGRILLLEPFAPVAGTDAVVSGLRSEYFKRCGSVGRSSPYIEPSRNGVT